MVILRGCGERLRFSRGDGDECRGNGAVHCGVTAVI